MNQVTYGEYRKDLDNFIAKHCKKSDIDVYTSPYSDGQYRKAYTYMDGQFTEINREVWKKVMVEVFNSWIEIEVHAIEHEYWSTDDSKSKYWYEAIK